MSISTNRPIDLLIANLIIFSRLNASFLVKMAECQNSIARPQAVQSEQSEFKQAVGLPVAPQALLRALGRGYFTNCFWGDGPFCTFTLGHCYDRNFPTIFFKFSHKV